jgi:hypothetical protein
MARKGKSTEEIIAFLREAEVRLAQRETAGKILPRCGGRFTSWRILSEGPSAAPSSHTACKRTEE